MREKLLKLMNSEKLTASRLAELLGIRSSGISHIISGRNNPSFDLLQKILKRFPNINPDWLLLDSEQMYRSSAEPTNSALTEDFQNQESAPTLDFGVAFSSESSAPRTEQPNSGAEKIIRAATNSSARGVKRIIVLFDDNTFESYEVR